MFGLAFGLMTFFCCFAFKINAYKFFRDMDGKERCMMLRIDSFNLFHLFIILLFSFDCLCNVSCSTAKIKAVQQLLKL